MFTPSFESILIRSYSGVERMRIETAKGLGRRGYCGSAGDIFLSTVPPRLDGKERNRAGHANHRKT
jgi:hypothetical protein